MGEDVLVVVVVCVVVIVIATVFVVVWHVVLSPGQKGLGFRSVM
jgi:hypothetical protein